MSCHAKLCSSFSLMLSSASIISTWTGCNCILLAYGPSLPNARMDKTRQCILWGLLGKVVFLIILVFKGRNQLRSQDRNKSPCTVWGRTVGSKAYRLFSSTVWWKVLTSQWGLGIYLIAFWIKSYRATELQISWKPAFHSIPTKDTIMFSVSHSPKAANDCSPYQTRNTQGLLQANFLRRADLKIAISKGTGVIPVAKEHDKRRKYKMMPWLFLLSRLIFPFCVLFARAKQVST